MRIYADSFKKDIAMGYGARESISKLEFRFQDNLLARTYNKLRHIRQGGILLHLKLNLDFDEFA
ncbi:MAG: hypothetical protein ACOCT7_02070 [Candidatus Saliniplasma sp.]